MQAGAGRTKRVPVTHFGRNVYDSPQKAYDANRDWVCKHIGERFAVCGFPKMLKLDKHGISHGYVDDLPEGTDALPF